MRRFQSATGMIEQAKAWKYLESLDDWKDVERPDFAGFDGVPSVDKYLRYL